MTDPKERLEKKAEFFPDITEMYSTNPVIDISNVKHVSGIN